MGAAGLIGNRRIAATANPGAMLKDTFGAPKLGKLYNNLLLTYRVTLHVNVM